MLLDHNPHFLGKMCPFASPYSIKQVSSSYINSSSIINTCLPNSNVKFFRGPPYPNSTLHKKKVSDFNSPFNVCSKEAEHMSNTWKKDD